MTPRTAARHTSPADASTVPEARHFVRDHLAGTAEADLTDMIELVVSELVGNVVLHVGGDVAVAISATPGEVLIEVSDSSTVAPRLHAFSDTAHTGRGMRLVHSLAAEHGVRLKRKGKTVWARVTSESARRSDDELIHNYAEIDWLAELDAPDLDAGDTPVVMAA